MILDLHTLNAVSSGLSYFRTREEAFKRLFVGVGDATLSAWFTDFSGDHFPSVRSRHAQGSAQAPLITVIPQAESVTQELLGDFGGRHADTGEALDTYMIQESAELAVFARTPDMARVYHVLTRASIAMARRAMHRAGYHVYQYGGSDPLSPEEELASEELGIYVRRLRVTGQYQVQIPIPANIEHITTVYSGDKLQVLSETLTDDAGVAGGVGTIN
jgi:hypothetical protein